LCRRHLEHWPDALQTLPRQFVLVAVVLTVCCSVDRAGIMPRAQVAEAGSSVVATQATPEKRRSQVRPAFVSPVRETRLVPDAALPRQVLVARVWTRGLTFEQMRMPPPTA
jgi:hypothetical protein